MISLHLQRILPIRKNGFSWFGKCGQDGPGCHTLRYKCKACVRRFDDGIRRDKSQAITDYVEGKQTQEQLAENYGGRERTIRRNMKGMRYVRKTASHKDMATRTRRFFEGEISE